MALLNTITSPSVYNAYTFVGYDSLTGPITSVTFQVTNIAGSPEPIIDNFTVVPEPTTWLAGALALGAIVWTGRRRLARA